MVLEYVKSIITIAKQNSTGHILFCLILTHLILSHLVVSGSVEWSIVTDFRGAYLYWHRMHFVTELTMQ